MFLPKVSLSEIVLGFLLISGVHQLVKYTLLELQSSTANFHLVSNTCAYTWDLDMHKRFLASYGIWSVL